MDDLIRSEMVFNCQGFQPLDKEKYLGFVLAAGKVVLPFLSRQNPVLLILAFAFSG